MLDLAVFLLFQSRLKIPSLNIPGKLGSDTTNRVVPGSQKKDRKSKSWRTADLHCCIFSSWKSLSYLARESKSFTDWLILFLQTQLPLVQVIRKLLGRGVSRNFSW